MARLQRLATDQAERRGSPRRTVLRKALVVINGGWSTYNARVLDLSDTGAQIELDAAVALPELFQLRFDMTKKTARRVWIRNRRIGVRFE